MTQSSQRYENPPIQEAVCQITFPMDARLTRERIAEMQPAWAEDFPNQQLVEEARIDVSINVQQIKTRQEILGHKLICRSADGKSLVQLGGDYMNVNRLAPYPGWEHGFRDMILEHFQEVVGHYGFSSVARIGLRYIDRIVIPEKPLHWQKWFDIDLALPDSFQEPGAKIQFNFQNSIDTDLRANLVIASVEPSPEGSSSVIMDLDIISARPIGIEDVTKELERVHEPHPLAFESVLRDNTRQLFG